MLRHARGCLPHQVSQLVMLLSVLNRSGWPLAVLCYRRSHAVAVELKLKLTAVDTRTILGRLGCDEQKFSGEAHMT